MFTKHAYTTVRLAIFSISFIKESESFPMTMTFCDFGPSTRQVFYTRPIDKVTPNSSWINEYKPWLDKEMHVYFVYGGGYGIYN